MSSSALSVAAFIARLRAADSDAAESSSAAYTRVARYRGSSAWKSASGSGSNSNWTALLLGLLDQHLHRRDPPGHRRLREHRLELGEHDVDLVHPVLLARVLVLVHVGADDEVVHQRVGDLDGVLVGRLLGETGPRVRHVTATEVVVRQRLSPDRIDDGLLALAAQQGEEFLSRCAARWRCSHRTTRGRTKSPARPPVFGFARSTRSGWSRSLSPASALSTLVISFEYGRAASTRACALEIRDVAIISCAFVIFLIELADRIRRRNTRTCAAI